MVKVFFIPLRKGMISNLLIAGICIMLFISLGLRESISVFSNNPGKPIYQGNEERSFIALECNVVWGTEFVEPMLNILLEKDARITFFIGGEWASDNKELLQRMFDEGHELGNHGYRHKHHSKLDLAGNRKEIQETEDIIYSTTGFKTVLFAPPYGDYNETTVQAAKSMGYKTLMWSIDTIDWRRDGVDKILQRVFKNPHNGALILMHPTEDTIKALPRMIDGLRELGYEIATVSQTIE